MQDLQFSTGKPNSSLHLWVGGEIQRAYRRIVYNGCLRRAIVMYNGRQLWRDSGGVFTLDGKGKTYYLLPSQQVFSNEDTQYSQYLRSMEGE